MDRKSFSFFIYFLAWTIETRPHHCNNQLGAAARVLAFVRLCFPLSLPAPGIESPTEINGVETSVTGVTIQDMVLRNAGKECVRLRYG